MTIAIIGKFTNLHDEEYIARSFEMIGHKVKRIPQNTSNHDIEQALLSSKPDILLYCKWEQPKELDNVIGNLKRNGMVTVCWLFDIYFNYTREHFVKTKPYFKSDFVFTTDGGNQNRFEEAGVNHKCVRQGIYREECVLLPFEELQHEIVFVGSDSPVYPERSKIARELNAHWVGRKNTNEVRGMALNELYASTRVVIGDSWYSPHYWSNRIVETLGRGGFLIHRDVPGLKEEYPYLVTYDGTIEDLKGKMYFYRKNEAERREIIKKNFEWVKNNYTMEKKCQELINYVKTSR